MPTAIWSSRLRSGSAHCDLALAAEARRCSVRSGLRGDEAGEGGGRRRALLKSSNHHLAGEEKGKEDPRQLESGASGAQLLSNSPCLQELLRRFFLYGVETGANVACLEMPEVGDKRFPKNAADL